MHKNCRCAWPLMLTTAALALAACTTDPAPVPAGTAGETTCGSTRVGQVHCQPTHDAPEPVVNEVPKN